MKDLPNKSTMKIAYITVQFPTPSETFASNDVNALKRMGHIVDIYSLRPKHKKYEQLVIDRRLKDLKIVCCGIKAYFAGVISSMFHPMVLINTIVWLLQKNRPKMIGTIKCLFFLPASMFIVGEITSNKYDVMHLFWGHYPSIVGYIINERRVKVKTTMFLGAYDLRMALGISFDLVKKVDMVFTHTNVNVNTIKEKSNCEENKISVIYRGVDTEFIKMVSTGCFEDILSQKKLKIACVSRLMKVKGVQYIIDAMDLIVKKYPEVQLIIAGDGNYRSELEKKVQKLILEKHVKLIGHVSHRKVIELLEEAAILVHLTEYQADRLPNVIKEAMCCGTIPITSFTPGINELIDENINGYILKKFEKECVFDKIDKILNDNKLRIKFAKDGRRKILKEFNADHSMWLYESNWKKLFI